MMQEGQHHIAACSTMRIVCGEKDVRLQKPCQQYQRAWGVQDYFEKHKVGQYPLLEFIHTQAIVSGTMRRLFRRTR